MYLPHAYIMCSALFLDSNAQDGVEPYGIQVVKDIEAFLQIALLSILIHTRCSHYNNITILSRLPQLW